MKNIFKYGVVPLVIGAFLLCVTFMLLPTLINVQKFLPQIEKQVSEYTGRPFSVGSDFGLTFFPWLSVTFSDMHLGNNDGESGGDFIQIDSFEARVKLLPLLLNKVEVSRFVVSGLDINLKRDSDGATNYHLFPIDGDSTEQPASFSHLHWLLDRDIAVNLFAITGGSIRYEDDKTDVSHMISDVMVLLNDVSSRTKAKAEIKALVDGYQIKGSGEIGPVSADVESLFMDVSILLNDRIQAVVKGDCSYPDDTPNCDLTVKLPKFSLSEMYIDPVKRENFLRQSLELEGEVHGTPHSFTIVSGAGAIDDTPFSYSFDHMRDNGGKNQLDIYFKQLDLDHYFVSEKVSDTAREEALRWPFIELLKKVPFSLRMKAESINLADIRFAKMAVKGRAENGVLQLEDGTFALHGGTGAFDAEVGLKELPLGISSRVNLYGVQADSFFQELTGAPLMSGSLTGRFILKRSEHPGSELGKSFVGNGFVEIENGTIQGVNLLDVKQVDRTSATEFNTLGTDLTLGDGIIRMEPVTVKGADGQSSLRAFVQLDDRSFTVSPASTTKGEEPLSVAGTYGSDGLRVDGYTDVHETKVYETRDAKTLVDETMPAPIEEDVTDLVGTPLIDPAIVAQRFGLRPELIKPDKAKKAYNVGSGRIIIRDLQELDSSILSN